MLGPAVITANSLLVWIVQGFCFGLGLSLAWYLVGIPFRRYMPALVGGTAAFLAVTALMQNFT